MKQGLLHLVLLSVLMTGCEALRDLQERCVISSPVLEVYTSQALPAKIRLTVNGEVFLDQCLEQSLTADSRYFTYPPANLDPTGTVKVIATAPTDDAQENLQLGDTVDIEISNCEDNSTVVMRNDVFLEFQDAYCTENYDMGKADLRE